MLVLKVCQLILYALGLPRIVDVLLNPKSVVNLLMYSSQTHFTISCYLNKDQSDPVAPVYVPQKLQRVQLFIPAMINTHVMLTLIWSWLANKVSQVLKSQFIMALSIS